MSVVPQGPFKTDFLDSKARFGSKPSLSRCGPLFSVFREHGNHAPAMPKLCINAYKMGGDIIRRPSSNKISSQTLACKQGDWQHNSWASPQRAICVSGSSGA